MKSLKDTEQLLAQARSDYAFAHVRKLKRTTEQIGTEDILDVFAVRQLRRLANRAPLGKSEHARKELSGRVYVEIPWLKKDNIAKSWKTWRGRSYLRRIDGVEEIFLGFGAGLNKEGERTSDGPRGNFSLTIQNPGREHLSDMQLDVISGMPGDEGSETIMNVKDGLIKPVFPEDVPAYRYTNKARRRRGVLPVVKPTHLILSQFTRDTDGQFILIDSKRVPFRQQK